jgi:hypothetical protein
MQWRNRSYQLMDALSRSVNLDVWAKELGRRKGAKRKIDKHSPRGLRHKWA